MPVLVWQQEPNHSAEEQRELRWLQPGT
jgi:hypothetical protein